jgi:hypothetical protein
MLSVRRNNLEWRRGEDVGRRLMGAVIIVTALLQGAVTATPQNPPPSQEARKAAATKAAKAELIQLTLEHALKRFSLACE